MSATVRYGTGLWPSSEQIAARDRRVRYLVAAGVMALAAAYAVAVVAAEGSALLVAPFAGALAGIVLFVWPRSGVYALFGAALLFEEWGIAGLSPVTTLTHFFQNLSGFSEIPVRLSAADLLVVLSVLAWLLRRLVGANPPARMGPLGWPVMAYGAFFVLGMVVGIGRGGAWNQTAALAELRGPLFLCVTYFLTVNLVREQRHMTILLRLLVVLTVVKAVQGLWNYVDMVNGPVWLDAVTAHEDVVFFNLALVFALAAFVIDARGRLSWMLYAAVPFIVATELVTQRRVAFVALAAALVVLAVLLSVERPRRTALFFGASVLVFLAYAALFWDQQGLLAQPVRAIKGILDPTSLSARDLASNWWRQIEDLNVANTIRQLPLTGVGLGQEYLFVREPPALTNFIYWRYMTHDAVLWVWLKAGVAGMLVFWTLVAQTAIVGARLFRRLPSANLKLVAMLPILLVVIQVVFSTVDLGLTYSRNMIVLGTVLGFTGYLESVRRAS